MVKTQSQLHIKILALLSAIILWFIVITVENTIYPFPENIEVSISNLEKNLSLANDIPDVKLYLQVDKEELKRLTTNDFEVFIDLKGAETGTELMPIIASSKNPAVKILKVEPSEIDIKLSPTTEKEVEVKVNVTGIPATNYEITEIEADTEKVKISGAQSIIEEIEYITAELILDGTEKTDMNQSVMLSFPESTNIPEGLVQFIPEQIVVSAKIISQLKSKEVDITPKFKNENEEIAWKDRIVIDPATVVVQGEDKSIKNISSVEVEIFELSALNRNGSIEADFSLPEGISLLNKKDKATIKLKSSEIIEKTFRATVKIKNGDGSLIADPSTINVKLSGKREVMNKVQDTQVEVNLSNDDLKDFEIKKLAVGDFSIPNGTQVVSFSPTEIKIQANAPTI